MSDLRNKAEQWTSRAFKVIVFFIVLGMIALYIAVTMITKVFTDNLAPAEKPKVTTPRT